MNQLAQFAIAFAACACLALAMNRHYLAVIGSSTVPRRQRMLRTAGWLLLTASYGVAGTGRGWGLGAVEWLCVFGLSAGTLVLVLNYCPDRLMTLSGIAMVVALLALALRWSA